MARYFLPFTTTLNSVKFLQLSLQHQLMLSAKLGKAIAGTSPQAPADAPTELLFVSSRGKSGASTGRDIPEHSRPDSIRYRAFTHKN